jgi:hypothetical protein
MMKRGGLEMVKLRAQDKQPGFHINAVVKKWTL